MIHAIKKKIYYNPAVPSGYTQVEYIESSGTQYIDTGVALSSSDNVKIRYQYLSSTSTPRIFGVYTDEHRYMISESNAVLSSTIQVGWYSTWLPQSGTGVIPQTNIVEVEVKDKVIYENGTSYATATSTFSSGTDTACIFSLGGYTSLKSSARVYACSIEDKFNGIPCKRNSDSVYGMYDTVTQSFFENKGTGSFTGGDAVYPTVSVNRSYLCRESRNLFNISAGNVQKMFDSSTGELINSANAICYKIECQPSTTYTLNSDDFGVNTRLDSYGLYQWSSDGSFISRKTIKDYSAVGSKTVTTDADVYYLGFILRGQNRTISAISDLPTDLQLEEGSTATAYEPYGIIPVEINKSCYLHQDIPSNYKQLSYIESSGTQWIDTGYIRQLTDDITVKYTLDFSKTTANSSSILGDDNSDPQTVILCMKGNTFVKNMSSGAAKDVGDTQGTHEVKIYSDGNLYVDDVIKGTLLPAGAGTSNICLFSRGVHGDGSVSAIYNVKIGSARNMIPAQRISDDVVGMYDTVNNVFYTNSGTGSFIAGPEV